MRASKRGLASLIRESNASRLIGQHFGLPASPVIRILAACHIWLVEPGYLVVAVPH